MGLVSLKKILEELVNQEFSDGQRVRINGDFSFNSKTRVALAIFPESRINEGNPMQGMKNADLKLYNLMMRRKRLIGFG